jgi:hypothetical protein
MGQKFNRYVEGYNDWYADVTYAALIRNAVLTYNFPAGPGLFREIIFKINDLDVTTSMSNTIVITIDGVIKKNAQMDGLIACAGATTFIGVWASKITGVTWMNVQLKLDIPWESTASFSISNTASPDPTTIAIYPIYLLGR